ncbi:type-F conjugative transfer system pilin assembly protein TrbC [Thiobacillus denitrificans]|uniref:type-F conjugative transfer system pilin assembly protein TrbC n=1 Tax=Thiobacillus denitrificans TaxID=36861 RepID=UPI000570EF36|nr:type-F conjugative transfer system pilin assembly protein TrbC [Thiobacillus denitrificans]
MSSRFKYALSCLAALLIGVATTSWSAESDKTPSKSDVPTKSEVRDFLDRATVEAKRQQRPDFGGHMDNARQLATQNGGVDLNMLVNQYNAAAAANEMVGSRDVLYVFVSLSMPKASLIQLAKDVNKAGGMIAFRGFHNNKMSEMQKALKFLADEGITDMTIDPDGFKRYNVTAVPTYVVARVKENAERTPSCGATGQCNGADYIAVAGDVTLDYALEYMAGHGDRAYMDSIQFYLKRLSN